jgi:hypothetical protein
MADTKISALVALAGGSVATGDLLVTVDVSDTTMAATGTDKRLTVSSLGTALTGLALVDAAGAAAAAQAASQPLDADLTAIAALTTTTYGRSLLTLADAAALLTATGAQPLDADLTSIAALTTTSFGRTLLTLANAAALVSSAGLDADLATFTVPASTTISTFGASLIDDANAAASIATLGLDADLATFALPASTTISAFAKTLLDDVDAATALTTLGAQAAGATAGGDLGSTYPNPTVLKGQVGFTVGSPVVGSGYGINSTGGVATEQAFSGLLFYGTQWNGAATIDLRRINGSSGTPSAVLSGDVIGGMHIGAAVQANNTTLDDVAQIYCVATENYAISSATGNRWDFYVSKNSAGVNASTSKAVAFRIDQDGSIAGGFGTYGAVTSATWSVSNVGNVTAASSTLGTVVITSAGAVSGVTTLAMTGALSGTTTISSTNMWTQTRNAAVPTVTLIRDNTTATAANTNVGQISFQGTQDTSHNFVSAALIAAVAEAAYSSATNAPTQMRFGTTSTAASLVNRLIMDPSGSHHFTPTLTTGLVSASTFVIKADGSVWVAPTAYSSNQPSAAPVTLSSTGILLTATNIATDTTTGMQIATATGQKLGFYGTTPIVRGTAFTQTYSTASHTHAAVTSVAAPAGGTGTAAGGWDTSVNRDAAITCINAIRTDVTNVKNTLNGLIDDLQALGLIA